MKYGRYRFLLIAILLLLNRTEGQTLKPPLAEVKNYHGTPCLFVKGKPHTGFSYATHFPPREKEIKDFAAAGVHFFQFYMGDLGDFWKAPDQYDFSRIDAGFKELVRFDPQAISFLRMGLNVPKWWSEKHPEEVGTSYLGWIVTWQSMASELWRKEAGQALEKLVSHLLASDYADHVIGYFTSAGEEWTYPGCWWNDYTPYDYSKPMQKAFQTWLRQYYQNDISRLQKAWKDDQVTFETASVPSKERRLRRDHLGLRDPAQGRQAIDYEIAASEILVDSICHFAKVVKDTSERRLVYGAFYGYVLSSPMHFHDYGEQLMGHLALKKFLECPDIDILSTPANYRHRGPGEAWASQTLTQSPRLYGKLFMSEDDVRTPLAYDLCGKPANAIEMDALLDRISGWHLTNGITGWLMNMSGQPTWFDMPVLMAQVSRMNTIHEKMLDREQQSATEVAVLLDPFSYAYLAPDVSDSSATAGSAYGPKRDRAQFAGVSGLEFMTKSISQQVFEELSHLGAPLHFYLLDDLANPKMPNYKLYIFLSPIHLTEAQRKVIDEKVKRQGHTALWLYAAGLATEDHLSIEEMSQVIGMKMKAAPFVFQEFGSKENDIPYQLRVTDFGHPITRNLTPGLSVNNPQLFGPLFAVNDPAATILGDLVGEYYPFPHAAGLAVKEFPEWRSVYSSAPLLPSSLLRNIARYAGVHLYSDRGDGVYASSEILCVHTASAGYKTFKLPTPTEVWSVSEGRGLGDKVSQIDVTLPAKITRIYLLGERAKWAKKAELPEAILKGDSIPLMGEVLEKASGRFLPGWQPENLEIKGTKAEIASSLLSNVIREHNGKRNAELAEAPRSPSALRQAQGDVSFKSLNSRIPSNGMGVLAMTTKGATHAALRLETYLDWSDYEGLEIWWQVRKPPASSLLFQLTDGTGKTWRWEMKPDLQGQQWNHAMLDLRGLGSGLSNQAGFYFFPGESEHEVMLGPIRLLPLLHKDTRLVPGNELIYFSLQDWLVLGPFDDSNRVGLDLDLPPEHEIKLEASYPGKDSKSLHWQPLKINGNSIVMPETISWAVAYFLSHVYSPKETEALLLVGSDDGVKVWLNGAQIWRNPAWRALRPGEDKIPVHLKAGWNRFLFKINQGTGGWGLSAAIAGVDETPIPNLKNKALPDG